MTSRLSSLLVRDGVISVKRMEKAFQRQVLFGGGLDTILLEMAEITEQRLLQYLSLATGLPPATNHELDSLDPRAAEVCAKDMASRFKVVPLAFDGDALRVLARDPVDIAGLEDLASELGVPVQPFVAPEFRWELTFDRAFGRSSDERFVRVSDLVRAAAPVPAVGKPQTVVVDAGLGALQSPGGGRKTLIFSGVAMRQEMQRRRRAPSVPDGIVSPVEPEITPPEISMELPEELGGGVIERMAPHDTQRVPFTPSDARASEIAYGEISEAEAQAAAGRGAGQSAIITEPPPRVVTGPVPTVQASSTSGSLAVPSASTSARRPVTFDTAPLTAGEARVLLGAAEHRDTVFEILLRAIRGRAWYAAVLTVQGGAAIGRVALAGDEIDQSAITQVLIPLDSPSTFRQAVHTASPYIGPIATGDSEIDGMIKRMGGVVPPSALLMPLVLKNRVVALLIGHRGADSLRVTEVSELLPLAGTAGDSLGRIIMRGKRASFPPPVSGPQPVQSEAGSGPAAVPQDTEDGPTGRLAGIPRLSRQEPVATAAGAGDAVRASFGTIDELMAAVQAIDDEKGMELAIVEALTRTGEVLPWLGENFPGKLKVDRYDLGGRHLKAAQHGPVLDLVVRMGATAADFLAEKIRDTRKEIRYYAALCASESRPDAAMVPMVERLFDSDYGVREVAVEGLRGYPVRQLDDALELPRRALHSEDLDKIKAASDSLAALADVRAIPDLLDVHGRGGDAAVAVGKALVGLTKQDFGINNKKWRQWWDRNRKKNRIEWLLDGLAARDPEIRRSSAEDLRKATGEYFGYHHDLPKRERELARQRWTEWWNQTGRLRFLPPEEHERNRPTAVLPPRRVP